MKKILFIILLLTTYSFAQEYRFKGHVIIDSLTAISLIATDTASSALQKSDSTTIYATKTDIAALPTVAETKSLIGDSTALKLNKNLAGYDAYANPTDADIMVVQKEGSTDLARVELGNMPISTLTQQEFIDLERYLDDNYTKKDDYQALSEVVVSQSLEISALYDSIAILRQEIGNTSPVVPSPPKDLVMTGDSASVILTWTNTTDSFDSTIIYYQQLGSLTWTTWGYVGSSVTSDTITGLGYDKTYQAYLRHRSSDIFSIASNYASATTEVQADTVTEPANTILALDFEDGTEISRIESSGTTSITGLKAFEGDSSFVGVGTADNSTAYGGKSFTVQEAGSQTWASFQLFGQTMSGATSGAYYTVFNIGDYISGGWRTIAEFQVRINASLQFYQTRMLYYNSSSSAVSVTFTQDDWNKVVIQRVPPTAHDANNGLLNVWVNDVLVHELTGLDNAYLTTIIMPDSINFGKITDGTGTGGTADSIFVDDIRIANDSTGLFGSEVPPPVYNVTGDYFVDYVSGSNTNDGRTQATAWRHCPGDPSATGVPDVTTLVAGDTVIFKGGVEYLGQVVLGASGTLGNEIVFKGTGWGTGRAIFNMQNTRAYAFSGGNYDYVKVEGFNIFNYARGGYPISISSGATYWTIDSCTIAFMNGWAQLNPMLSSEAIMITGDYLTIQNCEFFASGQDVLELSSSASNINILNNDFGGIDRGDSTGWFSVAIKGKGGRDVVVRGNTFHDGWQYGGNVWDELNHAPAYIHVYGTADGAYTSADPYNWIIEQNYFYNDLQIEQGTGTGDIEITTDSKKFYIRNNLVVNTTTHNTANILISNRADSIWVENNTFIMRDYSETSSGEVLNNLKLYTMGGLTGVGGDSIWIRNNIFWNDNDILSSYGIHLTDAGTFDGVIENNAYFSNSAKTTPTKMMYCGGYKTFAEWQAYGFDDNSTWGYTSATVFADLSTPATSSSGDYSLNASASTYLKTGGLTLSGFTTDFEGVTRTAGWSIGAYEYVP